VNEDEVANIGWYEVLALAFTTSFEGRLTTTFCLPH
jgi:hypothetical protein